MLLNVFHDTPTCFKQKQAKLSKTDASKIDKLYATMYGAVSSCHVTGRPPGGNPGNQEQMR